LAESVRKEDLTTQPPTPQAACEGRWGQSEGQGLKAMVGVHNCATEKELKRALRREIDSTCIIVS